jgi:hypothetical protein
MNLHRDDKAIGSPVQLHTLIRLLDRPDLQSLSLLQESVSVQESSSAILCDVKVLDFYLGNPINLN